MATQEQIAYFINGISPLMTEQAGERLYKIVSAAIAQGCLESAFGTCSLSKYNNFFGLKAGKSWKGKVVNRRTMEEYTPGTLTSIVDAFRVYDSVEEGVKGYYDFLDYARYKTVRLMDTPETYLKEIKAAGYATSAKYVQNNMNVVNKYGLRAWDEVLRGAVLSIPQAVISAQPELPVYEVGKTYETAVELNVRADAGGWARKLTHEDLTENAKAHDLDMDGAIDKGTRVTCKEVARDGSNIWIRIPSGWVAAYWRGNTYIKAAS